MSQREDRDRRGARGMIPAAAILILMVASFGCDSSVNVSAPRVPTVPPPLPPGTAGLMVSEDRPISGVEGVSLEGVGLVQIDLGATEALTITAPESVMPLLTSDVVGGLLVLARDSESYQGQVSDIRYDLELRRLQELFLHGVGDIRADGIETDRFRAEMRGVGDIRASGRVDRQEVTVAGVGGYFATNLESRVASVNLTSGNARIWATERIEGFVGVGCVLEYWGTPALDIRGRGTVTRLSFKP